MTRHAVTNTLGALAVAWLVATTTAMTIGATTLVAKLLDRPSTPSQCPALVKEWQAVGVPKHIQIKCKEFFT
jgi:hypothetical protein